MLSVFNITLLTCNKKTQMTIRDEKTVDNRKYNRQTNQRISQ